MMLFHNRSSSQMSERRKALKVLKLKKVSKVLRSKDYSSDFLCFCIQAVNPSSAEECQGGMVERAAHTHVQGLNMKVAVVKGEREGI